MGEKEEDEGEGEREDLSSHSSYLETETLIQVKKHSCFFNLFLCMYMLMMCFDVCVSDDVCI